MGNVTQCMAGKLEARVLRPDGIIVEYNYPVQVALLMTLYPDYLVVQSSTDPVEPGEKRKIKIMEFEDRISLGQSYVMYPTPSQFKQRLQEAQVQRPVQAEGTAGSRYLNLKLALTRSKKKTKVKDEAKGERRRKRLWRIKIMARTFLSLFAWRSSSGIGDVKEGGWVPLLDFDGMEKRFNSSSSDPKVQRKTADLTTTSGGWKPDLDDIPESPRNPPKGPYEAQQNLASPGIDDQGLDLGTAKIAPTPLCRIASSDLNQGSPNSQSGGVNSS